MEWVCEGAKLCEERSVLAIVSLAVVVADAKWMVREPTETVGDSWESVVCECDCLINQLSCSAVVAVAVVQLYCDWNSVSETLGVAL